MDAEEAEEERPSGRRVVRSLLPLLETGAALLVVVIVLSVAGSLGRVGPTSAVRAQVSDAQAAYDAFAQSGARGQVLVAVVDRPQIAPETFLYEELASLGHPERAPRVREYDLVSTLMIRGIAREVYFVVPDDRWEQWRPGLEGDFATMRDGGVLRRRLYGLPITIGPESSVPLPTGPVIVYADGVTLDRIGEKRTKAILDRLDARATVIEKHGNR